MAKQRSTNGSTTKAPARAGSKSSPPITPPSAPPTANPVPAVTTTLATGVATQSPTPASDSPTHEQIAKRAYEIWVAKGRPHGKDIENWKQAERELLGR